MEGGEISLVRQNNLVGYSLDSGSTVLSFPVVWEEVALGLVDVATLGDDAYLGSSALGSQSPLVVFSSPTATVNEADGSISLEVQLLSPDGNAVSVDVVFDGDASTASAADVGGFR